MQLTKSLKIDQPVTLIPAEKYESLLETLEVLNNKKQLTRIESALKNIQKGKVFFHKDVFGHHQPNLPKH